MIEVKPLPNKAVQIGPEDNVAVALTDLQAGEEVTVAGQVCVLRSTVKAKHKFLLRNLDAGDPVTMYGVVVGRAMTALQRGDVLTTSNTQHQSAGFRERTSAPDWNPPDVSQWRDRTFLGYVRSDGQVGTRNYWLVIPLVFCENRNIRVLQEAFEKELGLSPAEKYRGHVADLVRLYREGKTAEIANWKFQYENVPAFQTAVFPNLDGVKFLTHEMGCGGTRQDARSLCGLLAGYIHHPNVAGATVLSLGCQNAQFSILREELRKRNPQFDKPLLMFDQQTSELESSMLSEAIRATFLGLIGANEAPRTAAALSKLTVGLKCGGSDGFSGITANPAVGQVADWIAALGGKSVLAEFPELCGVEQNLVDRCKTTELAERFTVLMNTYATAAEASGSGFDMNPSPGNIKDGLITDAMKSAGAARKGGSSPINDVLDYPEYATQPGLNLLCTPGNDVESVTAEVGAGANVVLFTSGLGTPTGNPIAPVLKISTNSSLAHRMHDIIDVDAGAIITSERTLEQVATSIFEAVIQVASGERHTKAEENGQDDFIPWKRGVSL